MTTLISDTPETTAPASAVPDKNRQRRQGKFIWLAYVVLISLAVAYIFPFLINLATSFKTEPDAASDPLSLLPATWSTLAYGKLFLNSDFPLWFGNSVVVTVFVTCGRVFFDLLAGYALARIPFRGRSVIFAGVVAIMAVPGVVLLIPKFQVINQLGLYDS